MYGSSSRRPANASDQSDSFGHFANLLAGQGLEKVVGSLRLKGSKLSYNLNGSCKLRVPDRQQFKVECSMYFHNLETFEDWDANHHALVLGLGAVTEKINKAIELVRKFHDQPRMFTKGNYNRHPLRVARILAEEINLKDETSILIALCHDLDEWSEYNIENLKTEFGHEVYQGVQTLTWNQVEDWADFVARIVNSHINNLLAIKIADKLDNNRASALSGTVADKQKAKQKTEEVILPLVEIYLPTIREAYKEVLVRLG